MLILQKKKDVVMSRFIGFHSHLPTNLGEWIAFLLFLSIMSSSVLATFTARFQVLSGPDGISPTRITQEWETIVS